MTEADTQLLERLIFETMTKKGFRPHGGGDGGGDPLEPRIARLEVLVEATKERMDRLDYRMDRLDQRMDRLDQRMDRLDTDIRHMLRFMIVGFFATWALFAAGFLYLSDRIDATHAKIDAVAAAQTARMDAMNTRMDALGERIDRALTALLAAQPAHRPADAPE